MNNINDYIKISVDRINEFLPTPIVIEPITESTKEKMPFGISSAYDFFETEIMGCKFLLCGVEDKEGELPPSVIERQRIAIVEWTGIEPIFIFRQLQSYKFSRYSRQNLNIVVGNKQLFLPSIFLIVGKDKKTLKQEKQNAPIFFQLCVLYHLQREALDNLTTYEIASRLNVSYATANRGIRWMQKHGYIEMSGKKERRMNFLFSGNELWNKALPHLSTPIDMVAYTPEIGITNDGLVSELNALAEYTLYNGGSYRIAISKDEYQAIKNKVYWDQFGEAGIEVWKYDPKLLSGNGVVDRLSLYLLLKDYEDERVQIELENMIKEFVW